MENTSVSSPEPRVRSGSTTSCASAVGAGAMAVQFVYAHIARTYALERAA